MKLRIKGDTLRLRLTQTEVKELSTGKDVVSQTRLDPVSTFTVSLTAWNLEVPSVELQDQTLQIQVPATHVGNWANSDDEGLEYRIENGSDSGLMLWVEKDFACLTPRADETDNFPHPGTANSKC